MSAADRDEPFLKRWSRRKAEARKEEPTGPVEPEGPQAADAAAAEAPPIDPAELPDPDTLDRDSDFTVFLREGVPEELRRRALRRLWRSDPVLANLDGLNDYDGDFTGVGMALGEAVRTAWRAGRGYLVDADENENEINPPETPETAEGEAEEGRDAKRISSASEVSVQSNGQGEA